LAYLLHRDAFLGQIYLALELSTLTDTLTQRVH